MSLILIYNGQTETIEFSSAFDEYCSIFDEICKIIIKTFDLSNLEGDYDMVYFDSSYHTWINFNIHVTKRITELIRRSRSKILKIRIEHRQKSITKSFIKTKIIDKIESKTIQDIRCAHLIIWLDEHIGHPLWHKQLKRDCLAMINTNTSFMTNDHIDTLIQSYSDKYGIDSISRSYSKYSIETTNNYSSPFQCTLYTVDNTDKFFQCLNMCLKLTRSLSIIVSEYFAKDIVPIVVSREQEKLVPDVPFLYILCSNVSNYYNWTIGYIENGYLPVKTQLELFDDEKALFVRLLNDISRHLTLEADSRRLQKDNWDALQYYSSARQLFLNSLPWNSCYSLRELDHLDQCIEQSKREVTEYFIKNFDLSTIDDKYDELEDKIGQQCVEILEGI